MRLVGRLAGVTDDGTAQFSGSLPNQCALADLKLGRLLDTLDEWATNTGLDAETEPPERPAPTRVPASPASAAAAAFGRDQDGDLGDGLPARVSVAAPARPRCQRTGSPRRRRDLRTWAVPDERALPAPTEIDLHRRRRRRRRET